MVRKTVFITGASNGIGLETARLFAENGYNIIGTYNSGNIEKLKEYCEKANVEFLAINMNLVNTDSVCSAFEKAFASFDYIDAVVCNAGISLGEKLLVDFSVDEIEKLIDTNLKGTVICNQLAMKYLLKQKHGSIVNVSSIYGKYGGPYESVYSATKAGIIGLTKSLAVECAPYGVRVNSVSPGYIQTNMTAIFNEEEKEVIKEKTPLNRLGQTTDVANLILFLASDKASFITGEDVTVSGGVLRF